jgi:hypothetical protein
LALLLPYFPHPTFKDDRISFIIDLKHVNPSTLKLHVKFCGCLRHHHQLNSIQQHSGFALSFSSQALLGSSVTKEMSSSQNHVPETGVAPQDARHPAKHKELYPMSNWKYDSFLWVMSILADLFFREVHPRGSWKVPRHGPVLFVAAPHNNQVCSPGPPDPTPWCA